MANRATVPIVIAATLLSAAAILCILAYIGAPRAPAAGAASSPANVQANADAGRQPKAPGASEGPEDSFIPDAEQAGEVSEPPAIVSRDPALAKEWDKDLAQLRKEAEAGSAPAQFVLGLRCMQGIGAPKDDAEGVKWFRKAAEQGLAGAECDLGTCYYQGEGVPKDAAEAVKWYSKAAEQGLAGAQFNLGVCYAGGEGVRKDVAEAAKWYRKAAEQGDAGAQVNLGVCYGLGLGVPKDEAEAVKWFRKAAEQGHSGAQFNLGVCYDKAQGVPKDAAEAVKWYRKAADGGDASAQLSLGLCYATGEGVPKDAAEAVKWYRKAAEQGLAEAQYKLGVCHLLGEGVPKDAAEAVKWFRKAAEQGDAKAQCSLGVCYADGQGVPKDAGEAAKWFQKAAEQGIPEAQFNLGLCYANGKGVRKDVAEASMWYRKAAEQGDASAQFNLGLSYADGTGVAQDAAEAVKWYRKAAEQGDASAQFNLAVAYQVGQGVLVSQSAALEWYCAAGRSYLEEGKREDALTCYDRMKRLDAQQFLTRQLFAALYPQASHEGGGPVSKEMGSGTAWPAGGGYVLTNHHVVAGRARVRLVRGDGTEIRAEVVSADAANDLVLLRADAQVLPRALRLASSQPRVGQRVFTMGYPHPDIMGGEPKLTEGIINATTGIADDPRLVQISVAMQAGNSGGPLLNMQGEVIGVVCAKLDALMVWAGSGDLPENVGYAIKVGYVRTFLESAGARAAPAGTGQPPAEASLEELAARIRPSVMLVIAE